MTEKINDAVAQEAERKAKKDFNLPVFFEWVKLIQRFIMVLLTIALCLILRTASYEIRDLKSEMKEIRTLVEVTRQDVNRQIDEIQKDGVKFHLKLW